MEEEASRSGLTVPASEVLPSATSLMEAATHQVFDKDAKPHALADLYSIARLTLVVLVRHVYCGSCHAYLQQVASNVTVEELEAADASIVVIGCGDPRLIEQYREFSSWPFPVYMDPDEVLYRALGTTKSSVMGSSSTYATDGYMMAFFKGISKTLKKLPSGLAFKGGAPDTIGGEFLFESSAVRSEGEPEMTWCHRMKNTTDHTDVSIVRRVLRLEPRL